MATMWSGSRRFEFDAEGNRAPAAKAYFYSAGTTTPTSIYEDGSESIAHDNPVLADGAGRWPAVFVPDGDVRIRVTTSAGVVLYDDDDLAFITPVADEEASETTELETGDMMFKLQSGVKTGWVRSNSRTIGSAASGATERANADTANLFAFLWNNLNNTVCPVSGGRGGTAVGDFAANKTIGLPDLRGRSVFGDDFMGTTDAGRLLGISVVSGDRNLGSLVGYGIHTLTTAEAPSHTHTGSGTAAAGGDHNHGGATGAAGAHSHSYYRYNETLTVDADDGGGAITGVNRNTTAATTHDNPGDHTHTISSSGTHTHAVTITTDATGGGTAHNNMPPAILGTWYLKL